MRRALVNLAIASLILGCAGPQKIPVVSPFAHIAPADQITVKNGTRFPICESFTRETIGFMSPDIQSAVTTLTIHNKKEEDFSERELAHCHRPTRDICLLREKLGRCVIFHEAGHAWRFAKGDELLGKWRAVAGGVYGQDRYDAKQTFPQQGLVTRYGAHDIEEDIAEWVEATYSVLGGYSSPLKSKFDKSDPRYGQKLSLLCEYGALTGQMYQKILPLIVK